MHTVRRVKIRQPCKTGFLGDGQVAAHHHCFSQGRDPFHQLPEMGIHLRRAAGEVHHFHGRMGRQFDHPPHHRGFHDFRALGPGLHMAMLAGLVAQLAHVDLQHRGGASFQRGKTRLKQLGIESIEGGGAFPSAPGWYFQLGHRWVAPFFITMVSTGLFPAAGLRFRCIVAGRLSLVACQWNLVTPIEGACGPGAGLQAGSQSFNLPLARARSPPVYIRCGNGGRRPRRVTPPGHSRSQVRHRRWPLPPAPFPAKVCRLARCFPHWLSSA